MDRDEFDNLDDLSYEEYQALVDAGEVEESEDWDLELEQEIDDEIEDIYPKRSMEKEVEVKEQVWFPIKGFRGYYVSKAGKVKGPRGVLKGRKNPLTKYWDVNLRGSAKYIHVLVFEQWNPKVKKGNVISHENGNKNDNSLKNLKERSMKVNMMIHSIQRRQHNDKRKNRS